MADLCFPNALVLYSFGVKHFTQAEIIRPIDPTIKQTNQCDRFSP